MISLRSFLLLNGLFLLLAARTAVTRVIEKENFETIVEIQDGEDLFKVPFKLEETYTADFLPYAFNGTWRTDTTILYTSTMTGDILLFDVTSQRSTVVVDATDLMSTIFKETLEIVRYHLSPSGRYLLVGYDMKKQFRHSMFMRYVVYDIEERKYNKIANSSYISLAKWAPLTDDLVYVLDNDIYHRRFINENGNDVRRLTYNGINGVIYNGVPDWVYEEEVLHGASALWFSPDGSMLVYATFDDRNVKEMLYSHYGDPGNIKDQYPTEMKLKYPKPGTPNPVVTVTLVDLNDPNQSEINLKAPIDVVGSDNVMSQVQWEDNYQIVVMWSTRIQNKAQLVWYNLKGEIIKTMDMMEKEGWLDPKQIFFYDGVIYIRKLQPSGTEAGRFHHVTRYDDVMRETPMETDLTPGPSEVLAILAIDYVNRGIYYLASGPGEPSQRNLYYVPLDGSKEPTCISCNVLTPEGNTCTYADAIFSPLRSYYVLTCQGPDPTFVSIFDTNHEKIHSWQDNRFLRRKLAGKEMPLIKKLNVLANGYESKVKLLLPHNFDETKTYPMLVNVYGGPGTAIITDAASVGYSAYMTTNRSVIYAYIDGRGSSNKGSKMLFEIYRKMGTVEMEDQIAVTKYLQETYPWIDSKKTGIWGWSYGGFSTAMILAKDKASVFKCGVSVAPVSSWIYYDSIYTERYMGLPTPEDNLYGYNQTDVSRRVEGIRGKKFLLVHGSGDDNVHYQQSLALAKALEVADILFQQITYTDEAHGLLSVLPHLYHSLDRFWSDCFDLSQIY